MRDSKTPLVIFDPGPLPSDTKRFGMDLDLSSACPQCGKVVTRNLDHNYLSYPWFNKSFEYWFSHDFGDEAHEWSLTVRLNLTFTINPLPDPETGGAG